MSERVRGHGFDWDKGKGVHVRMPVCGGGCLSTASKPAKGPKVLIKALPDGVVEQEQWRSGVEGCCGRLTVLEGGLGPEKCQWGPGETVSLPAYRPCRRCIPLVASQTAAVGTAGYYVRPLETQFYDTDPPTPKPSPFSSIVQGFW